MGLLDNINNLENMSAGQQGLLALGLGMMGQRGSFGEAVSHGGLNGLAMMQQAKALQKKQALEDLQMENMRYAMSKSKEQDAEHNAIKSALSTIDPKDHESISRALMSNGDFANAISYQKMIEPSSTVQDAIWATGGDTDKAKELVKNKVVNPLGMMNYNLNSENTRIDNERAARQETMQQAKDAREDERFNRDMAQKDYADKVKAWEAQNPNYLKNAEKLQEAKTSREKLNSTLDMYLSTLKKYSNVDRHNPFANSALQTAWQEATWPLRGESMMNTGVLNPGEIEMLNKALTNPTSWSKEGFRDYGELESQINKLKEGADVNVKALEKQLAPKTPYPVKDESSDVIDTKTIGGKVYIKRNDGQWYQR